MAGIFSSVIFNTTIFNTGTAGPAPPVVVVEAKLGTGGIDVYKPTGLTKRKKLKLKKLDERIEEFQDAQLEIATRLRQEFTDDPRGTFAPIAQMSMLDVDREIKQLLHEKIRMEDEELLLLLIAAAG